MGGAGAGVSAEPPPETRTHPTRRRRVAVLHNDHAVGYAVAPGRLDRGGHGARGLAGSHDEHASALGLRDAGENVRDQRAHVAGGEGGVEDGAD